LEREEELSLYMRAYPKLGFETTVRDDVIERVIDGRLNTFVVFTVQ
jgi:hypothetical protein